jgi:hypothetical protein
MVVRSLALLSLTLSVTSASPAGELLLWKLTPGDVLTYDVQNTMDATAVIGGKEAKSSLQQTMRMSWEVEARGADNTYVVGQVIQRIRVKMSPNGTDTIEFDSGAPEPPRDPIVRSLAGAYGKIVNQKFRVTMAPTGEIRDVEIPPALLETLKTVAAGPQASMDDETLKQTLGQTSVILPDREISSGDQWASQQELRYPFATVRMSPTMTYKGMNKDGIAEIQYVPSVDLEPQKGSPMKLSLKRAVGTGIVQFDAMRGRIARMQQDLTMDMLTEGRGQNVSQHIVMQTVMSLAE